MKRKTRDLWVVMTLMTVMGCSTADDGGYDMQRAADGQPAVDFGVYLRRSTAERRAGTAGVLTTDGADGTQSLKALGFGVFGYYTDDALYDARTAVPDFMYNQQVAYDDGASKWSYDPVKYWPNEAMVDHLSFFAYAPFTPVTALTGIVTGDDTQGIGAVTRATGVGNPWVRYYVSFDPSRCVDLCWATPHKNRTRYDDPATIGETSADRVTFNFRHSLAALNVQVKTDVDGSQPLDGNSRVWVRQVTFEGFDQSGQLSLTSDSDVPLWYDVLGGTQLGTRPVTVYDGRRDGREGAFDATTEEPVGLNPDVVQGGGYTTAPLTTTTTGVIAAARNLFKSQGATSAAITAPVYVIPTGVPLRVNIIYDVETWDEQLLGSYLSDGVTHGRTIENNITATVTTDGTTPLTLEAGKKYTVTLKLGLNSVKLAASVTEWGSSTTGEGELPDDPSDHTDTPVDGSGNSIDGWTDGGTTEGEYLF